LSHLRGNNHAPSLHAGCALFRAGSQVSPWTLLAEPQYIPLLCLILGFYLASRICWFPEIGVPPNHPSHSTMFVSIVTWGFLILNTFRNPHLPTPELMTSPTGFTDDHYLDLGSALSSPGCIGRQLWCRGGIGEGVRAVRGKHPLLSLPSVAGGGAQGWLHWRISDIQRVKFLVPSGNLT
jgi:hypothetical protein